MLCTEYSRKQNRTRVERKTQGSDPTRPVGQGKGFRLGLSLLKGLKHVLGLKKSLSVECEIGDLRQGAEKTH